MWTGKVKNETVLSYFSSGALCGKGMMLLTAMGSPAGLTASVFPMQSVYVASAISLLFRQG